MLIDSHCHFDFEPFAENPEVSLQQAKDAGVKALVIPAVSERNWLQVQALAENLDGVYFALGLHPFFSQEHSDSSGDALFAELERLLSNKTVINKNNKHCVAVGECGLDFAIANVDKEKQERLLMQQIGFANHFELPVLLHCRKAFPELVKILKRMPPKYGAVYHAFSGSYQQAMQLVDLGIKIGVGGTITYPRAKKTRHTIQALPLSELMLETDAPDMPVAGFQGEPNHPARLPHILDALVELRSESRAEIERVIWATTTDFFKIQVK